MWRRILELNDIKKEKRRKFAEKERLENIAMQEAYTRLVND